MSFSNLVRISIVDLDFLNFDKTHPILTDCSLSQAQRRFGLKCHIYDWLKKYLKVFSSYFTKLHIDVIVFEMLI